MNALDAAAEYQGELKKEIDLYKGITRTQDDSIQRLHKELHSATVWYRKPEFVAPTAAILAILLLMPSIKGYGSH